MNKNLTSNPRIWTCMYEHVLHDMVTAVLFFEGSQISVKFKQCMELDFHELRVINTVEKV